MLGPTNGNSHESNGILLHTFQSIFEKTEEDLDKNYTIKCSYFEIYNELVYDLLNAETQLSETL